MSDQPVKRPTVFQATDEWTGEGQLAYNAYHTDTCINALETRCAELEASLTKAHRLWSKDTKLMATQAETIGRLEQAIDRVRRALEAGEWGYNVLKILDATPAKEKPNET